MKFQCKTIKAIVSRKAVIITMPIKSGYDLKVGEKSKFNWQLASKVYG